MALGLSKAETIESILANLTSVRQQKQYGEHPVPPVPVRTENALGIAPWTAHHYIMTFFLNGFEMCAFPLEMNVKRTTNINRAYRVAVGLAAAAALLTAWMHGAVSIHRQSRWL